MRRIVHMAVLAAALAASQAALAQTPAQPTAQSLEERREAEVAAAGAAAKEAAKTGPATVALAGQGSLALPAGYLFVPEPQASRLMRAIGNATGPDFVGAIFPADQGGWFATVRFVPAGYIKDDDAKSWNADELLKSLQEGTEESNALRAERGIPPIEVRGWVEKPAYDAASHKLVWSALAVDKGSDAADGTVNYNTYALGREGYFSLNFVTGSQAIEAEKPIARELLSAIHYEAGKTYSDFNASTDRVAEFGLAALIGGVAAKKLGLFALIGAFLLKFAKFFAIAGVALVAVFAKFIGRKRSAV